MKTKKQKLYGFATATLLIATLSLQSCKPEKPEEDENEVITTLSVIATNGAETKTFTFRDLDGTGSGAPVQFDTIKLSPSSTYDVNLLVLDETKSPADTTSNEIEEEKNEHIFFLEPNPSGLATVTILDKDDNNLNVGLHSSWTTGSAGTGTLKITLRHQPGVKDGTYAPGDTDVEVEFPVVIE